VRFLKEYRRDSGKIRKEQSQASEAVREGGKGEEKEEKGKRGEGF